MQIKNHVVFNTVSVLCLAAVTGLAPLNFAAAQVKNPDDFKTGAGHYAVDVNEVVRALDKLEAAVKATKAKLNNAVCPQQKEIDQLRLDVGNERLALGVLEQDLTIDTAALNGKKQHYLTPVQEASIKKQIERIKADEAANEALLKKLLERCEEDAK